jgi:L-iditol 2-dehydrogenase
MKTIVYDIKPVGWVTCQWLKWLWRGCLLTGLNGLSLRELAAPELPGEDWVRVRTLLGGICGTDLAILAQKQRPNSILQAYGSMPMLLGHENVSVVDQVGSAVDKSWIGKRVCVEPTLGCVARGITPMCDRCAAGEFGACENFGANGIGTAKLPPGTSIGYNSRTGGSYGEYFVAHESQLVEVPTGVPDEQAILTDPAACSLHGALRANVAQAERILIYGVGAIGLTLAAVLRAIGYAGRIDAVANSAWAGQRACDLGADDWVQLPRSKSERFEIIARRTAATVQRARLGTIMLSGGYDIVFDCVGSGQSLDESLKWTRARGQVVMIATGHGGGADLTPIWFRELEVIGTYGRQIEHYQGRRIGTYPLVHEFMAAGKLNLGKLLTHAFRLKDYRQAFNVALNKNRNQAVKVAFDFR